MSNAEVKIGGKYYKVYYAELLDPDPYKGKCPTCLRSNAAHRIDLQISTVEDSNTGELVLGELVSPDDGFRKRVERALRKKLVESGSLVTRDLFCENCNGL